MKPMAPRRAGINVAPASDPACEGLLYIAVRTTGIFCRPGCPARKPLPKNVEHFRMAREAIEAGYRACKRCRPMQAVGELPDGGYQAHSGFREAFVRAFDATPGKGSGVDPLSIDFIESPLGPLMAAADETGLSLLEFTDRRRIGSQLGVWNAMFGRPLVPGEHRLFEPLRRQLAEYFEGRRRRFDLPLQIAGTPFQERVWNALLTIPYGEVRSYQQIARTIGAPRAMRAVGRANGSNRISIIVPCHRVIGADGSVVGYGGGPRRKEWLLALERGERSLF